MAYSRIGGENRESFDEFEESFKMTEAMMGYLPNSHLIMAKNPELLEAFEKISTRKKLYSFDCRHYDVYLERKVEAANSASEWFEENLLV